MISIGQKIERDRGRKCHGRVVGWGNNAKGRDSTGIMGTI